MTEREELVGIEMVSSHKPKEDDNFWNFLATGTECVLPAFTAIFVLRIIQYRIELKIENWQKRKQIEALTRGMDTGNKPTSFPGIRFPKA